MLSSRTFTLGSLLAAHGKGTASQEGTAMFVCQTTDDIRTVNRAFREAQKNEGRLFGLQLRNYPENGEEKEKWRLHATHTPVVCLFVGVYLNGVKCTWGGKVHFQNQDPQAVRERVHRMSPGQFQRTFRA